MTTAHRHRRRAHFTLAAVLSGAVALVSVLRRFPPEEYGFYPRCPIYEWTGFLCPGCGGTRALAALAHGNLAEALHWNALVVMLLPVLAVWGALAYRRAAMGLSGAWPRVSNLGVAALLAIAAGFEFIRN